MLNVSVQGGTGAGRKRPQSAPKPWVCPTCGVNVAKHWNMCPADSTPRP